MDEARAWWLLPALTALALGLTGALRRYALARRVLDVPGPRSSHRVPTPRGGGLAIALAFTGGAAVLAAHGVLPAPVWWALAGAGGAVAVIGFIDDHRHVPAGWRLAVHGAAALWALAWLGGMPPQAWPAGWPALAGALLALVWLVNLYNFMDGIDALAAAEALCVTLGAALLYALAGRPGEALPVLALAAAVAGFLYWNVPPARVFLGDAGSGFLGATLGVLAVHAGWSEPRWLWAWAILPALFVADASVTVLRRAARGERLYEAHCTHAYQHAARRCKGHAPVVVGAVALNLLWLWPLALGVGLGALHPALGVAAAYLPLGVLALGLGAGAAAAAPAPAETV